MRHAGTAVQDLLSSSPELLPLANQAHCQRIFLARQRLLSVPMPLGRLWRNQGCCMTCCVVLCASE